MGVLNIEINSLVNMSMSQNSWKTYQKAVESFGQFRLVYNYEDNWPIPIAENILASYSELHTLCNARIKSVRSSCEMGALASGVVGFSFSIPRPFMRIIGPSPLTN
jgi:hypothetical protein